MFHAFCKSLALCATVTLIPAFAERPLEFEVNFPITVGTKRLPAGKYEVNFTSPVSVMVRNLETYEGAIVLTNSTSPARGTAKTAAIRFNRYGAHSFMSEIWSPGYGAGRQILLSKAEVEMASRVTRSRDVALVRANPR